MRWDELTRVIPDRRVPRAGEDLHVDQLTIYEAERWVIRVLQPGKYWNKTAPHGGDFLILISSRRAKWDDKPFTHDELFQDVEAKSKFDGTFARRYLLPSLSTVIVCGASPSNFDWIERDASPGLETAALLTASQCLALAESRRFAYKEKAGGGRYLPGEFALGIADDRWSAAAAAAPQKEGIHGLKNLVERHGGRVGDFRRLAYCDDL